MFAIERKEIILRLLNEKGHITITELIQRFNVSAETIRKDLINLESEQKLLRTHGGAVSMSKKKMLRPLSERMQSAVRQKSELAYVACGFIENGDVIAIDEGSTAVEFAKELVKRDLKITAVTHSLDVFNILSANEKIDLILCAGTYLKEENAFVGSFAEETAKKIYTNKAFIFPSAVCMEYGISIYQNEDGFLQMQKTYVKNTDKVFILADSEKFERRAFIKAFDMSEKYCYITDNELSDDIYDMYKQHKINIIRGKRNDEK